MSVTPLINQYEMLKFSNHVVSPFFVNFNVIYNSPQLTADMSLISKIILSAMLCDKEPLIHHRPVSSLRPSSSVLSLK